MQLPSIFINRVKNQLNDEFDDFLISLEQDFPTSIRLNQLKSNIELPYEKVAWCNSGFYLNINHSFVLDPLWHIGKYYVQEASSMSLEKAFLEIKKITKDQSLKILDLCAAPGGKSTHISQLMSKNDILISNEIDAQRCKVLKENIRKNGHAQSIVTNKKSEDWANLGELFDVIILDAPCSGEGMFRKDIQAVQHWSENNIKLCVERQENIINNAKLCLKENGFLIYSTCTFNVEENENQIEKLIKSDFLPIQFKLNGTLDFKHRFWFHKTKGEGFFISLLQKKIKHSEPNIIKNKKLEFEKVKETILENQSEFTFIKNKNKIEAISQELIDFIKFLPFETETLGIETHYIKNNFVGISPYLPFSINYNIKYLENFEIEEKQILDYFKGNALTNSSQKNGLLNIVFQDNILGIGKGVNQRVNNLFPTEWSIKKTLSQEDKINCLF